MNTPSGTVIALVSDVDDPDGLGRVRLRYPWLAADGTEGEWVRIARPFAGKNRGFFYTPEVDDEAVVAYQWGDMNHPVVLGFLHNKPDPPPTTGIDVDVRRLRSTVGHEFDLDDRDGRASVRLRTNGGHQLELHDDSGYVEVVTAGGQKIRMDDQPARIALSTTSGTTVTIDDEPSRIELKTAVGVTVTISDTGGVSVSAPAGPVSVTGLSADVTATTSATIKAPMVTLSAPMLTVNSAMAQFSGVVQCSALLTQSVVSASYTPGAGNIW